jgi:hypothetical protein
VRCGGQGVAIGEKGHSAVLPTTWNVPGTDARTGRYPSDRNPCPVEVIQKPGGRWPHREVAVTMNRMRCKPSDGKEWTTARVRELRERLGTAPFDPNSQVVETINVDKAATRLGICVGSVYRLIRTGVLRQRN